MANMIRRNPNEDRRASEANEEVNDFRAWFEWNHRHYHVARKAALSRAREVIANPDADALDRLEAAVDEMDRQDRLARERRYPGFRKWRPEDPDHD